MTTPPHRAFTPTDHEVAIDTTTELSEAVKRINAITETTTDTFTPLHEVRNKARLAALVADMTVHGWRGPPIVTEGGAGGNAYTGVHRLAAADQVWHDEGIRIEIRHVDIGELCDLYGINWRELVTDVYGDTYDAATQLHHLLPADVKDYLGYDVGGA